MQLKQVLVTSPKNMVRKNVTKKKLKLPTGREEPMFEAISVNKTGDRYSKIKVFNSIKATSRQEHFAKSKFSDLNDTSKLILMTEKHEPNQIDINFSLND